MKRSPVVLGMAIVLACGCHAGDEVKTEDDHDAGPQVDPPYDGPLDGVDILLVLDNQGEMEQGAELRSTGLFTLINSLQESVENLRVAVISNDLGLQYGADRSVEGFPYSTEVPTCTDQDARGDNGSFRTNMPGTVEIESGKIACEQGAAKCPGGWSCDEGLCVSPSGDDEAVNCKDVTSGDDWAETKGESHNPDLAIQAACMGRLGTSGCGIEQQLEAPVLALERETQQGFLVESHLLAVIIYSDEEDCSIMDRGLFETEEWRSKTLVKEDDPSSGLLNTACNLPKSNEESYLFPESRYREELVERKGGDADMIVFGAIVGVPYGKGSPCIGRGDEIGDCLDADAMELELQIFEQNGTPFKHFAPACTREQDGYEVTSARPGRRFVEVAQSFGELGYVSSICQADWNPAMREIAEIIAGRVEDSE